MADPAYEYGIGIYGAENLTYTLHRTGMTEDDARTWLQEVLDMGFPVGVFVVIRRPLGVWERADG